MISSVHVDHSQLFWGLVGDRLLSQSVTSCPNRLRLPRASRASGTRGFPAQGTAQTQSWAGPSPPQHSPSPQGSQTVPCPTPWRSSSVWKPQQQRAGQQALGASCVPALQNLAWFINTSKIPPEMSLPGLQRIPFATPGPPRSR